MCKILSICCCLSLFATSCLRDKGDQHDSYRKYVESFNNRTQVQVDVTSEYPGELVSVYFDYPYAGEMLAKQPAMTGLTPVNATLEVPKDVESLYILCGGELTEQPVGDVRIASMRRTRADVNKIDGNVLVAINSTYFPEATNNVRGEDLFKCTDLVISETPSTGAFEKAEVWLTFLGDGGCHRSDLYGQLWFYTYDSSKQNTLGQDDCTFYGVVNGEIREIPFSDIQARKNMVFNTRSEIQSGIPSYKRHKIGVFTKGRSIGFVYYGNSRIQFTTPHLNAVVDHFVLKYLDKKGAITIDNRHVANGFIRHIQMDNFEGNVLGMENRAVTEAKYDGDYNDILCLIESNPLAITPSEPIDPPVVDEYKVKAGIYLFEDNYPSTGDFDFNDAVIEYKIIDFYKSSNKSKQVLVRALAKGAYYQNEFGFLTVGGDFSPFLKDLSGYANVRAGETYEEIGSTVSNTLYGEIIPYLYNGKRYIYTTNFNTYEYPCVLDIPLSDPDDESWRFAWPLENESIDNCYYFLHNADGGSRAKDWYRVPKDAGKVFNR